MNWRGSGILVGEPSAIRRSASGAFPADNLSEAGSSGIGDGRFSMLSRTCTTPDYFECDFPHTFQR